MGAARVTVCALTRTRKRPLRVSRRARSTALWVALRSAVLARRLGLRLGWVAAGAAELALAAVGVASTGGGRASVWTVDGETGVAGPFEPSTDEGDWGAGEAEGEAIGSVIAIEGCVYSKRWWCGLWR